MLQSNQTETLLSPSAYPPEVARSVEAMPPLAVQIANRWMLGWPEQVKELLASKAYLPALTEQEEQERRVLSEAQNLTHLARHEVMSEFGLSAGPPGL